MLSDGDWTLYFKIDTLDVWRGNPPNQNLRTGHGIFVIAWKHPVVVPGHAHATAGSANISYVFSCNPPIESAFDRVVFYGTPFPPRDDSIVEQWHTFRETVATVRTAEPASDISWGDALGIGARGDWKRAWERIYAQSCNN